MKIKNGFELRDVCGEKVIIAEGLENLDFSKMVNLNESAAYLWEAVVGKDFDVETLTSLLCNEYEVSREVAEHDVQALLKEWIALGMVE